MAPSLGATDTLTRCLPEHVSLEMLYLEVKWSSLLPYEASCDLLREVLCPFGKGLRRGGFWC